MDPGLDGHGHTIDRLMSLVHSDGDTPVQPEKPGQAVTWSKKFSVSIWLGSRLLLWLFPLAFIGLFFFYPLGRILAYSFDISVFTPENLKLTFDVLRFTLYQAFLSTLLTLILGLPAAYLFARYRFPGKALLHALSENACGERFGKPPTPDA